MPDSQPGQVGFVRVFFRPWQALSRIQVAVGVLGSTVLKKDQGYIWTGYGGHIFNFKLGSRGS